MKKKLLLALLMVLGMAGGAGAQFNIPRSFVVFTKLLAADVNLNFTTLADAVNRTGGTITGTILVGTGVLIDGVDVSTYLAGGKLTALSNTVDSIKVGGGITAAGNAIVDTTGKVPALSSTYFTTLSATNLTALAAANLTGTIASATQDSITRTGTVTSGTWSSAFGAVSGANLTSLNAANFSNGTVPPARLASGSPDVTMLLRGDGQWASIAGTSIPTNMVVFSSNGACPSGFIEYTVARGRAIVGLPSGGTAAGTVGSAMTDLENRSHTHSIPGLVFVGPSFATAVDGGHVHDSGSSGPSATVTVVVESFSGFTQTFASVASASHVHNSVPFSGAGNHNHSGSIMNGGTTNSGSSGSVLASQLISYEQMMACLKL